MSGQLLLVRNVTKRFGGVTALNNVSFSVVEGEIVGLMGPNGAGKTTLFNVVSGNIKPDSGRIYLKGNDITYLKPHEITRLGIARTYQIPQPFMSLSVYNNLLVAAIYGAGLQRREAEKKVEDVMDLVGIKEKCDLLPSELTLVDLRRLELARALSTSPFLLLIDEAGAGLTEKEIPQLIEVVKRIHELGVTIILVEHMMAVLVATSDRVIVLNNGQILAEGTPETVMNDINVIQAYLGASGIASRS